jgi:hypothetical protein
MNIQRVNLAESLGWWNVETKDGYILASFGPQSKRWARLYQRIASRTDLSHGRILVALKKSGWPCGEAY